MTVGLDCPPTIRDFQFVNFNQEPKYFPLEKGVYEVAPGLRPLGADLGAGDLDHKIFQITSDFKKFRENKINCYSENISKYRPRKLTDQNFKNELKRFFISRLESEYPDLITKNNDSVVFNHTGDELTGEFWKLKNDFNLPVHQMDEFDFLSLQFPEDWAITSLKPDGHDHLEYLNVCSPSHWAPEDKLDLSFLQVHHVIPGSERLVAASKALVEAMIHKGPFVRFVWSFVTDKNLNHHPIPAKGHDPDLWKGRSWNASQNPPFHLRLERQVTWGFPAFNKALFTIRVSFIDGNEILNSSDKRHKLRTSLESMTPASRTYKGVDHCFDQLVGILK